MGEAYNRYISLRVSGTPGHVLLAVFGTMEMNLLKIKTASDFTLLVLFVYFMKCMEAKFQSFGVSLGSVGGTK